MTPLAPYLSIPRVTGSYTPPPPPPPVAEGDYDLLVNTSFNPASPTLKNGTPFNSLMEQIYDGIINHWVNGPGQSNCPNEINTVNKLNAGSSYQIGRNAHREMLALVFLFRATGDVRLLDELARLAELGYDSMRTTWYPGSTITREPHGERFWPTLLSGSEYGGDDHLSDTPRSFKIHAQIAHILDVNRTATSASGHNYAALADKWRTVLEGYERVWSRKGDGYYPDACKVETTYRGKYVPGTGFTRAAENDWPINNRGTMHTNHTCALFSYYLGKNLDKNSVGVAGYDYLMNNFLRKEVGYLDTSFGEVTLWGRGYWSFTSTEDYLIPVTYNEYVIMDLLDGYFEGLLDKYTFASLARILEGQARAYNNWVLPDGRLRADIGGGTARTGVNYEGTTHTWGSACTEAGFCNDRSDYNNGYYGHAFLIPWDEDGLLTSRTTSRFLSSYTGDGTWDEPEYITVPVAVFLREAGIANDVT